MFRTGFALYFLIGCWAVAGADNCGINADGPSTCAGSDQTTLLQSRVQVSIDDTDPLSSEAIDDAENPLHPLGERNPNFLNEEGATAVCGSGEEVVSTNCLGDSLVKSQARATARMHHGDGYCTAWLVKAKTANQGALMLTTGHCGVKAQAGFDFNYVAACPGGAGASQKQSCKGRKLNAEVQKDEQAIYELEACPVADAATPILLDIGNPDAGEGIYILGHPNGRPQLLSHEEVHDNGRHCEVRHEFTRLSSKRISYYCDTQGGNSGSPVFSARTGYAFAIHSHGGCSQGENTQNSGALLGKNPGVVAAFKWFGIPYIDRAYWRLFIYEEFTLEAVCFDHAQSVDLKPKSLAECKKLCVNSLTCVGVEYSAQSSLCQVNYRSTASAGQCVGDAKNYKRKSTLTKSLVNDGVKAPCIDKNSQCPGYSQGGLCTGEYASWMATECPKSCSKCTPCIDKNSQCPGYSQGGLCTGEYASWMATECPKSCSKCS